MLVGRALRQVVFLGIVLESIFELLRNRPLKFRLAQTHEFGRLKQITIIAALLSLSSLAPLPND